jgi:anti-sigma regulatory factor (Ser/Thr protein kinase)
MWSNGADFNGPSTGWTRRKLREQLRFRRTLKRVLERRERLKRRAQHRASSRPPTPKQKARRSKPTTKEIIKFRFPAELDFVKAPDETLRFFTELRERTLIRPAEVVVIDHSTIQNLSPEAALVLIAELTRADEFASNCRKLGQAATNPQVQELLGCIGYFDYFPGIKWRRSRSNAKDFLVHRTNQKIRPQIAKELIQHFASEANLDDAGTKALYAALIECMDNVMKHAYPPSTEGEYLLRRWWLLGYRDRETHEVYFCFYDQGLGIPNTIRTRVRDMVPLFAQSDEEIIQLAVVQGHYSSTKDPTRGRGLPKLKKLVDNAHAGQLLIVSHKSRCIFRKGMEPALQALKLSLPGTLIVWTLRNK